MDKKLGMRIWGILLIGLVCASCAMDPSVVTIWGGDVQTPKMVKLIPVSVSTLQGEFTASVSVIRAVVSLPDNPDKTIAVQWSFDESRKNVIFSLAEKISIGQNAFLSATVRDTQGNSLSFSHPFIGYNERVPVLRINEVRSEYSKPKVEFIELYVVKSGNLAGVEICNTMNTIRPSYEFPSVEVVAGDYIVYHLRSVEEGLVNETGALDASAGIDSRPIARDFWDTLTSAPLKKTNVLLVKERKSGVIMDALLSAEADITAWPTDLVAHSAEEAASSSAWLGGSQPIDAFCPTDTTVTRTYGRNQVSADTGAASDWKVCPKSKCSPGATNVAH